MFNDLNYSVFCFKYKLLIMYLFPLAEPLIIEYVFSMAATSKTGLKCKLLSIQGNLDVINTVNTTKNVSHKKKT